MNVQSVQVKPQYAADAYQKQKHSNYYNTPCTDKPANTMKVQERGMIYICG